MPSPAQMRRVTFFFILHAQIDWINLSVIHSRLALSYTDFPRRPTVSYMDYHADHVRLTRMHTSQAMAK